MECIEKLIMALNHFPVKIMCRLFVLNNTKGYIQIVKPSDFVKTKMYYNFRDDLVKSMINNIKQGHIWISGNYSTLLGNGVEMLQQPIALMYTTSLLKSKYVSIKSFSTLLINRTFPEHICGLLLPSIV